MIDLGLLKEVEELKYEAELFRLWPLTFLEYTDVSVQTSAQTSEVVKNTAMMC